MTVTVLHGDLFDVLPTLDPDSVDAVVCDPPYGLGFMGRDWDTIGMNDRSEAQVNSLLPAGGQSATTWEPEYFAAWCEAWAAECLRVVKPGGHLIAFGATRTHHRLMQGVEDAGWTIRDCGVWLYRSGFPKSLDVSKAIDRAAGAERQVIGTGSAGNGALQAKSRVDHGYRDHLVETGGSFDLTAPATDAAARWDGWGTALKPAIEPWVLARRPLSEGTVAANVLRWGTGALNVDGCRAPMDDDDRYRYPNGPQGNTWSVNEDPDGSMDVPAVSHEEGRWPANVVTDVDDPTMRHFRLSGGQVADYPKASTAEKPWTSTPSSPCSNCGRHRFEANPCRCERPEFPNGSNAVAGRGDELHPTVKPLDLMRHLVRLVTPPGGTVLDPFAGTGTTGEAAIIEGMSAILVEREAAYLPLIDRRLSKPIQPTLGDV